MATVTVPSVKGPLSHSNVFSLGSFAVPESAISICRSMCNDCIRISSRGLKERAIIHTIERTAVAASRSQSGRNQIHPQCAIDSGSRAPTSTTRLTIIRERLGDSQLQEETHHLEILCLERHRSRVRWRSSSDFSDYRLIRLVLLSRSRKWKTAIRERSRFIFHFLFYFFMHFLWNY